MYIDALLRLDPYPEESTSDLGIPDMDGEMGAAVDFQSFCHRKLYSAAVLLDSQVVQPTEHGAPALARPSPCSVGCFLIAPVLESAFGLALMLSNFMWVMSPAHRRDSMIIDRTKSGPENLVALINSKHPGKNLTADQVTFGPPTPISDHPSQENTSIFVYPVSGKGYRGDPEEFFYSRMLGSEVKSNPPSFIVIEDGEAGESIREKVAAAFNLVISEALISDGMLVDIAESQYRPTGQGTTTCVISGKTDSLLYLDFNSGYQLVDLVTPEYPGAQG